MRDQTFTMWSEIVAGGGSYLRSTESNKYLTNLMDTIDTLYDRFEAGA